MYTELPLPAPQNTFAEAITAGGLSPASALSALAPLHSLLSGGWGHTQADAIIINNPLAESNEIFEGIQLETFLLEARNILDFTLHNAPDRPVHSVLMTNRQKQNLVRDDTRRCFDHITLDILLVRQEDFAEALSAFQNPGGLTPESAALMKEKTVLVQREFWFDITSFLEHNWRLTVEREQSDLAVQAEGERMAAEAAEAAAVAAEAESPVQVEPQGDAQDALRQAMSMATEQMKQDRLKKQ